MTNEEAKKAWEKLYSEIDKDNWLFVGTINPEMIVLAIKALEERPQGEWIGIEEYDDYPNKKVCECSECGKMISISHNDFPNFCENCGADMNEF